jgi:hypothetical protein
MSLPATVAYFPQIDIHAKNALWIGYLVVMPSKIAAVLLVPCPVAQFAATIPNK